MRCNMVRVASSMATSRRGRTRSAILRKPSRVSRVPVSPVASPTPQASGGTYLGGRTAPNTLAPTSITVPVPSSVPIAVLAWSPIRLPRLVRPVSIAVPATSSRTGPYVFFKFDVMVPAPRFAQRGAACREGIAVAQARAQVFRELPVEPSDEIVRSPEHRSRDFDARRVGLRAVPGGAGTDAPSHGHALAAQTERGGGEGRRQA